MQLFQKFGIPVPKSQIATSPKEVFDIAERLGGDVVVKAQVLAGGRGKGRFKNGFKGGVHLAVSPKQAMECASKMLGQELVTKQTGIHGKPCSKVLVAERMYLKCEAYLGVVMDRESGGPAMVVSSAGGMDIETVAKETPEKILTEPIDITKGIQPGQVERLVHSIGFSPNAEPQAAIVMKKLYDLFIQCECTTAEINPIGETNDGRVICVDAKLNFDDNAAFRQKEIFAMRDPSQDDPREVEAEKHGLNYISLDGNIGCMVNGAGLAMATMDAIKLFNGSPANFLDLGGGASKDQVSAAFSILNNDNNVKAILVNVFGGIARCDVIALGIISAVTKLGLKKPVIIRLAGTNVSEAKKLIDESGLRLFTADDLGEAARKAVRVVDIMRMADEAQIGINFELPL